MEQTLYLCTEINQETITKIINYSTHVFFLSIVYSSREQYKMCYAMEFRNTTYLLWVRNVELRYNGSITITTIILVVDPIPIKKYDDR